MVKVRCKRSERAKKLGRQFSSCAAARMRCLVCSGMDRAAEELFSAAETVPGVRFKCSAIVRSVTFRSFGVPDFALLWLFMNCASTRFYRCLTVCLLPHQAV